jgi:hypothetical protein
MPALVARLVRPRKGKKDGKPRASAVFDHMRAVAEGDGLAGPAVAGDMVGRQRDRQVLDVGQMLDNLLLVVGPQVDTVGEVRSGYRYRS